jgi:hypothetical protein
MKPIEEYGHISDASFSDETVHAMTELGSVLSRIYARMKQDGYDILDGRTICSRTGKEFKTYQDEIK